MRTAFAAAAGCQVVLVLASLPARAQGPDVEIAWAAPAGTCPDREDFIASVDRERSSEAPAMPLRSTVQARREGAGWVATVEIKGRTASRRELRGATCAEVAGAAALYLALVSEGTRPAPEPERVGARGPTRVRAGIEAGALLDWGSLPRPSPGLGGRLWWAFGSRLALAAGAQLYKSQRARLESDPRFGGDFSLWAAGLDGCARAVLTLWGCVGAEGGAVMTSGLGGAASADRHALWLAGRARIRAALALGTRAGLVADLGVAVPMRRNQFEVGGLGTVHQPSRAALRATLGFRFGFILTEPAPASH